MNNIEIVEVKSQKEWEKFNLSFDIPAFFQSWQWGDVQIQDGKDVYRFAMGLNGEIIGIFQVFLIRARRGTYLHVRHGPVFKKYSKASARQFLVYIKALGKAKGASFVRVSPLVGESDSFGKFLSTSKSLRAPIHNVDAENRWILPLGQNEDDLLKNMRKTTRYLIKKGKKSNIKIVRTEKIPDLKKFSKIYKETAMIKKFVPHEQIKNEFSQFSKNHNAFIYYALEGRNILAAAIVIHHGSTAIYRHGATSLRGRNTPASYLLQWHAILDAKSAGKKYYDFWGIAKDGNTYNPWFGLTQFKKGFGGYQIDYIHAIDFPLSLRYIFPYCIDIFTKIRKGHF